MADFVKESGHFYWPDGRPAYEVPYAGKREGMKKTTLREARKMGLLFGVTTITGIPAKPMLNRWIVDQHLDAVEGVVGCEESLSFYPGWRDDVREQATAVGREAAEIGTRIHGLIATCMDGVQKGGYSGDDHDSANSAIDALIKLFPDADWSNERSFGCPEYGFGGAVDVSSLDGDGIVVDWKGKDFTQADADKGFKPYPENAMQISAYRYGLGIPNARGVNIFFSRSNPGVTYVYEFSDEELRIAWEKFKCLMMFKLLDSGHDPR